MTRQVFTLVTAALAAGVLPAAAQSSAKPWGRVSFFANTWQTRVDGAASGPFNADFTTTVTYQFPELDTSGTEYGVDFRYSRYATTSRPVRVSVYEAFVGARLADGSVRVRAGNLWLNELGGLGSVAGGLFEWRQPRLDQTEGRFRAGVFGGLEPSLFEAGYSPEIRKAGGYVAYDGDHGRRHVVGFVTVRHASLTERGVLSFNNFIPIQQRVFIYQAAEYDAQPPAGRGKTGLTYFFMNTRWTATSRLEVLGTYNRGRSIDVRTLSDDVLNGRPILERNINGLLYESVGGRLTVTVVHGVRVYGGYSSDRTDRDSGRTGRILIGGYAGNIAGSGLDLTASDSMIDRPDGSYHSRYVSVGRQLGRRVYLSGDYSTSLSVVRYSRTDGLLVEMRPHTRRISGTGTCNLNRFVSLLFTGETARDDDIHEFRLLSGLTYRF